MNLKNKFIIIFFFSLVLLLLVNINPVSAFSHNDTEINLDVVLRDPCFLLYNKTNGEYYFFRMWANGLVSRPIEENSYYCIDNGDGNVVIGGKCNESHFTHYAFYKYDIINGTLADLIATDDSFNGSSYGIMEYTFSKSEYSVIYHITNVYTDNTYTALSNSSFFPLPPLTQTLVEEATKVQIMEQMKIMILGFLKYLLLLVISVIAFWKAWVFLKKNLKKA